MTARLARTASSLLVAVTLTAATACTSYFEIPIETPIRPKLDVSAFQRVLVAGFISGGSEDVDANLETVRLLRSQLRTKSELRVIDADVLPLTDVATTEPRATGNGGEPAEETAPDAQAPTAAIRDEKDLEPYEHVFANVDYWRKIGEEYQNPLIVTGTIVFKPFQQSGFVQREQEVFDSLGRRRVVPLRTYRERKGFQLIPRFVFIDGRSGSLLHSEVFKESILYDVNQSTPALSSYFELMDRLIPSFLSTLSSQKIRGTRVLLK
jgi:hypothetical protein